MEQDLVRLSLVLMAATVVIAACSSDTGDPNSFEVTYNGTECSYVGVDTLSAGQVEMTFINDSDEDVGAGVWQLKDGVFYEDFVAAFAPEADSPPAKGDLDDLVIDIAWLNRGLEGLEHRGDLTQTITVSNGTHGVGCARFEGDGPPVETQAIRSVEVSS